MPNQEARVLVTFSVFSESHSVSKITEVLGSEADLTIEKGESLGLVEQKAKRTRWTIQEVGDDLNEAELIVQRLLRRLGGIVGRLDALPSDSERIFSVCLSWYSGDPSPGIRLQVKDLAMLYQSNTPVEIIAEVYP